MMLVTPSSSILNPYLANISEPRFSLLLRSKASQCKNLFSKSAYDARKIKAYNLLSDEVLLRSGLAWFSSNSVARYKANIIRSARVQNSELKWTRVSMREFDPNGEVLPLESIARLGLLLLKKRFLSKLIFVEHVVPNSRFTNDILLFIGPYALAVWCSKKKCFLGAEQFTLDPSETTALLAG